MISPCCSLGNFGSPISARTLGHRNDPRDPAVPWTGYSSGRGRDGNPIDLVRELRAPATVEGGTYSHLVVAERHDSLGTLQWEKTVPLLRHFYELAREGSPKIQGFFGQTRIALAWNVGLKAHSVTVQFVACCDWFGLFWEQYKIAND